VYLNFCFVHMLTGLGLGLGLITYGLGLRIFALVSSSKTYA